MRGAVASIAGRGTAAWVMIVAACAALACRDSDIEAVTPRSIVIDPAALSLRVGDTARIVVTDRSARPLTSVRFSASGLAVRIDPTGLVTALAVGTSTVIITAGEHRESVPVSVR